MSTPINAQELEAYLDEALPVNRMTEIEEVLRGDDALRDQLTAINGQRDAGVHTLGGIWRRHRLSCPSRNDLGSYLLQVLSADEADYVRFHIESVGCRKCAASVEDLQSQQAAAGQDDSESRRNKYFQSSVGHLQSD